MDLSQFNVHYTLKSIFMRDKSHQFFVLENAIFHFRVKHLKYRNAVSLQFTLYSANDHNIKFECVNVK